VPDVYDMGIVGEVRCSGDGARHLVETGMVNSREMWTRQRRLVAMLSSVAFLVVPEGAVFATTHQITTSQTQENQPVREAARAEISFDIVPQPLQAALLAFSEQAGVQLIIAASTRGLMLNEGVHGNFRAEDALALLISGTNLEYRFTSSDTVTVRLKPLSPSAKEETAGAPGKTQGEAISGGPRIEEIILVGSRTKGRTATETPVPVDIVSAGAMAATGQTEVGRMLQTLAPSFNFSSSSVSDGTDALRPATLRGLGPDQTLVLVNGKRRHTSALVHVNTSVGRGATGVDLNAIPGASLRRIEVLRDGAAAQYGSDAIAGVINLVLKNSAEGGEANVSYGQAYEGDGGTTVANANFGFGLRDDGFLNITAEYRDRSNTNRAGFSGAVQYPLLDNGGACDATDNSACDPREFSFDRENFRIGDADSESSSFVLNAKLPLGEGLSAYAFGTYSDVKNQSAGFYRRANQYDRTVTEIYPDGFLPLINTNIEDYSASFGVEWAMEEGWDMDLSVNYGANSFQFIISNSSNASLGPNGPTTADAGTLFFSQTTFNFDTVKSFTVDGRKITVAGGAEYREENYRLDAGERASYADGGALNRNCPGCDTDPVAYASGFQVFRGFSPANEVDAARHNLSLYIDLETEISEKWLVAGAVRLEDYSDFGSKITGKLSSRFRVSETLAFRGSVASGFRAPSQQQKNFNSISTQFVDVAGLTVAQERGTFRNDSIVAGLAGVPELKEETSFSISAGFVANVSDVTLTADYYHIEIEDRIGISGAIDLTRPGFESVAGAASSGQFFVNAADTVTNGLDLVATYDMPLGADQQLQLSAAANWTNTDVEAGSIVRSIGGVDVGPLISRQDVSIIEEWQPKSRINFTANYARGNWGLVARLSQFGSYSVCEGACDSASNRQTFGAKWLSDFQLSYRAGDTGLKLSLGANNIFDVTPDVNFIGQARGGDIAGIVSSPGVFHFSRRSAPFGFNGGYWYARASYAF